MEQRPIQLLEYSACLQVRRLQEDNCVGINFTLAATASAVDVFSFLENSKILNFLRNAILFHFLKTLKLVRL